jgi:hypothetical protein
MSSEPCGCCEGLEPVTPLAIFNRPGLAALTRRVGEYGDFYETLLSRITTQYVDIEKNEAGAHGEMLVERRFPLRDLRTRASDDMTIALLSAYAVMLDVLTFYSERILNEGYLRTALELRSLVEMGRLVGYRRRPGVAASVFLAFTADSAAVNANNLVVPAGARVQHVPDPGLPPQTFETSAPLVTRPAWNVLTPRQVRPKNFTYPNAPILSRIYLQGTRTRLAANSPLLLTFSGQIPVLRLVSSISEDFNKDRTTVELQDAPRLIERTPQKTNLQEMLTGLSLAPSPHPASPQRLGLTTSAAFQPASAATDGLLARFNPAAAKLLPLARANAVITDPPKLTAILAPRVKATVYASTVALFSDVDERGRVIGVTEWFIEGDTVTQPPIPSLGGEIPPELPTFPKDVIDLDTTYDSIQAKTWVVILRPNKKNKDLRKVITMIKEVQTVSRNSYNFSAKVTRLLLNDPWLDADDILLSDIRSTMVYAAPELLPGVDEPIDDDVCGQEIELDRLVDGLQPGRWLIVTGERADLPVDGVPASELVMLNQTRQDTLYLYEGDPVSAGDLAMVIDPEGKMDPGQLAKEIQNVLGHPLPGDKTHTFLTLSDSLSYCYKRETLKIYANVAHATHGETRVEALGTGDGSQIFQTFPLKGTPPPLTYTAAIAANGIQSSLNVYVNDVRWHEAGNILDLGPASKGYLTHTDDTEKTSVMFGDGVNGARLPSAGGPGQENVQALYRRGIGKPGNVREGTISRILANASGMTGVINPLPASGGADPDGSDSTRKRTPLAVTALDRLVAVEDYADFSRLFAGIAKASAARLPTRYGHVVHVTIAGVDDIPIDTTSDLYISLLGSLKQYGDPYLPVQVERRNLSLLVISARIKIDPDYKWENVKTALEGALYATFGFESRELGQDAYAAEATAAMQAVPGVLYVDLDLFAAIPEETTITGLDDLAKNLLKQGVKERVPAAKDRIDPQTAKPAPSRLVILSQDIPSTLLLTEVPNE